MAVGMPAQIGEQLARLAGQFGVDELVISTFTDRLEDRLHSYALMASIFNLTMRKTEPQEPERYSLERERSSL